MSAAKQFALEPFGSPAPCGFPRCILDAFHEGDHEFPALAVAPRDYPRKCVICGTRFAVYGEAIFGMVRTCSPGCLLILSMREAAELNVSCRCAQRSYPHELRVHEELRGESYNPKFKFQWPWSLMLSRREEPSTERKAAV